MSVQMTILGMGQIGASVGLALAEQEGEIVRVGHDREPNHSREALKKGAVDRISYNLGRAVQDADVVLLALPLDQIQETLELILEDLKDSAVVMETAPVKAVILSWVQENFPENRHYVGLIPVLNPLYLHEAQWGLDAAHADLFKDGMIGIVTRPGTESGAIKLAVDLAHLLGATPLFTDPIEGDSLMGAVHLLPQLIAAGLLNMTVDHPGWMEARRFAGRPYAQVTGPTLLMDQPEALSLAATQNRTNMLRLVDRLIENLREVRAAIAAEDQQALQESLSEAASGRERWWSERLAADWADMEESGGQIPSASELLGSLLTGRRPREDRDKR